MNYPGKIAGAPALSWDGARLYFYSTNRPDGFGAETSMLPRAKASATTRRAKKNPIAEASPWTVLITLAQNETQLMDQI